MGRINREDTPDRYNFIFKFWSIAVSIIVILLILTVSTYAWFSSNRNVSTNRVEARSGTESLTLQISAAGGNDFNGSEETSIVQVNGTSLTKLMPVSTSDLHTFVYNKATDGDMATYFRTVENEEYYYHGTFYIRASAQGLPAGAKVALYLDEDNEVGGSLAQAESGLFLNAARLGLTFDRNNPVIFSLSDSHNETDQQAKNTMLNGTLLGDNQVLHKEGSQVKGVADPSIPLSDRMIVMEENRVLFPEEPLMEMELNRIYRVDVFLYLEGCDPDCSDSISMDEADIHLAFYGILEE